MCRPIQILLLCALFPVSLVAQTSEDESWKKTTTQQDPSGTVNSSRTSESFAKKGSRATSKKSLETIGPDGKYVPYSETETETVQVNATTVRTIQRSYGRDINGNRSLVQVTQQETKTSPNGSQAISRTTSNPDLNGNLQVVQKELRTVKKISPTVQESITTVLMPDINGTLSPSMKVQQRDTKTGEHSTQFRKSTLLPDGNGNWQTAEVREGSTKDSGEGSTTEERVLQPGSDGKLAEVQRTVSRDSKSANESKTASETYSNNVPGMTISNGLQLVEKTTSVSRNDPSGKQKTTRSVERPNAGNPSDGLELMNQTIDIVRPSENAKKEDVTTLSRDANGNMNVVQVGSATQISSKPAQAEKKVETKPAPKKQK